MTIDDALATLEEAAVLSRDQTVQIADVWEALDSLAPHCRERWPLRQFWEAAGADYGHEFARFQNCDASLNGIALQLAGGASPRRPAASLPRSGPSSAA